MLNKEDEKIPDISEEIAATPVTKIIEDVDCFMPRRVITLEYSGPNIKQIVSAASRILRAGMYISGTRTFLDDYYVDVTDSNKIIFHIYWHGIRDFDSFTKMWGWIRLKHGVIHPDGTGSVVVEFFAKLRTQWDKDTLFKRSPFYNLLIKLYNYVYYNERRRKYMGQCTEFEQDMVRRAKELLKLTETYKYPLGR
jgi:hypothetical protein